MSRSFHLVRWGSVVAIGLGLAACGLDSNVAVPSAPALPANSGATLSGAGAAGMDHDADVTEFGDVPVLASAGGPSGDGSGGSESGGIDSGGTSTRGAGGIGGAISNRGGAAGADGLGGTAGDASGVAGRASAAGAGGTGDVASQPPELYFSEYVEGSSSNKALEIAAAARSVLDGCKVDIYFNGSDQASVVATLTGVLEANQVLTLCSNTLSAQLGAACNQVARLTFNGNDAIALVCDDKLLDVIGQIGVDPGTAWGSGSTTTLDHTLRRACSVSSGDPDALDPFDPSVEWQSFPIDTFSGLGTRGC